MFHGRWIFWGVGAAWALYWGISHRKSHRELRRKLEDFCDRHWKRILFGICGSFFLLSWMAKISQYQTLGMHGQDFWLFVDILEQMKRGYFFITRFAPHELGMVQHGVVHPMLSWALLLPFTVAFGAVATAILYQPLMLTCAGLMLGVMTKKRWGSLGSLAWVLAFLASTQVGKVLMYEVHPEAGYPFFLFLWLWAMGQDGSNQIRIGALIFATLACAGIKEDSFLVLGPWIFWLVVRSAGQVRKWAIYSGMIALCVWIFQAWAVRNWASGEWGPLFWEGMPVNHQISLGVLKGQKWSSIGEVWVILHGLIQDQGGVLGWFLSLVRFLTSRPWLALIIFAPWVLVNLQFWVVMLPLAAVYSVLNGPNLLWNYYSAPFLGSFWFCASNPNFSGFFSWSRVGPKKQIWVTLAACFLGSSSFDLYWPKAHVETLKTSVKSHLSCLGRRGVVPSHLLPWVPLDRVWTDRAPRNESQWKEVDFVLFTPELGSYEMPSDEVKKMRSYLLAHPEWKQVNQQSSSPVVCFVLGTKN